jgi:hypothetical protein
MTDERAIYEASIHSSPGFADRASNLFESCIALNFKDHTDTTASYFCRSASDIVNAIRLRKVEIDGPGLVRLYIQRRGDSMKPYGGLTSAEDRAKVDVFLESPTTN